MSEISFERWDAGSGAGRPRAAPGRGDKARKLMKTLDEADATLIPLTPFHTLIRMMVRHHIGDARLSRDALLLLRTLARTYTTRLFVDARAIQTFRGERKVLRGSDVVRAFQVRFSETKYNRALGLHDEAAAEKDTQLLYQIPQTLPHLEAVVDRKQVSAATLVRDPAMRRMAVSAGNLQISSGSKQRIDRPWSTADRLGALEVGRRYMALMLDTVVQRCGFVLKGSDKKTISTDTLHEAVRGMLTDDYGSHRAVRVDSLRTSLQQRPVYGPGLRDMLEKF